MTVIAVTMVKNEADIIAATVGQMLTQVDHVIVADNMSTDGTREVLDGLPVTIVEDHEVGYFQSRKMSRLAAEAAERGADWVVPFDADEWWYCPHGATVGEWLMGMAPHVGVVTAELYDHVATAKDPVEGSPVDRLGWRRISPTPLPKVACRPLVRVKIEQGNHDATFAVGRADGLVVRHFPYRSPEQFVSKARNGAAAYAATDLPADIGEHWRGYGAIAESDGDEACASIFREWFWSENPAKDETLIFDPAP
jgi:glycosyltransferase involved in cell wall biosynthesis